MLLSKRLLCGVACAGLLAGSALADTVSPVEQVVVTGALYRGDSSVATKTDTPLIETPQSVSVISAAQLDLQGVQSLGEALRYSAGVNPEQYGGVDQRIDWFMIRGFQTSFPFIDGLTNNSRYTLMAPKVASWGIDSIEVLRGPSSVLYGQNVPGGLVNVVSKRPQAQAGGEVSLVAGSFGHVEGRGDVTGALQSDGSLLYRLTGSVMESGTQVDHVANHHYFLAPALTWQPDADNSITILSHVLRQADGFALQNLPAAGTLYASPLGKVSTSLFTGEPSLNLADLTEWDLGYNARHNFSSDWVLRQNLRFTHSEVGLGYVAGYGQSHTAPQMMNRFALDASAHQNNFAVDTNLEGHLTTGPLQHTLVLGVDYSLSHDLWSEQDGDAAPLDITHPVYGGPISLALDYVTDDSLHQLGLYAQDQVKYDRLVLTGSIRQDFAQTRTSDVLAHTALDQSDQAFTGRGGAVYLFDDGFAPYVSYSTSFQPTIGTTYAGAALKPTTADQWEAGLKYQPKGVQSFAMLSFYQINEQNVTTADPNPAHPNAVVQTGGARVRGIELSGDIYIGDGFSSNLAYSYMDATITSANDGTVGNRLMDAPRNTASAWINKSVSLRTDNDLTLGLGLRYIGDRYGNNANSLQLPSNTQLDAMVRYDLDHWRFSVNAHNLSDEIVVTQCDSTARCFYGDRRSVMATIGYRW